MEENLSSVNAEPVVNVEPQNTEPVQTNNVEPVEPQQDPVKQTPEENAKFAEQRRLREAAETKAAALEKENGIARKYGAEYGVFSENDIAEKYGQLGITTLEQFEEAVERQRMIDEGIDPDVLEKELSKHPDVVKAREEKQKIENFAEFQEFYQENVGPMPELKDLPQPVIEAFEKGDSMKVAFMEYDYKQMKEKQKAQEVNKQNSASSTGSVTGNGNGKEGYISFEVFEANKRDPEWVNKNYNRIMEDRATW